MLSLPLSSHDWIRRFVEQVHRLRPDLAGDDLLELGVVVHQVASPFLPEQVAESSALARIAALRDERARRQPSRASSASSASRAGARSGAPT